MSLHTFSAAAHEKPAARAYNRFFRHAVNG
jgi:hypothetical protein